MSVRVNTKSIKLPKRHLMYNLSVRAESSYTLLGEIFDVRTSEKSAEAVVVKIATEKGKEQRAEEQAREQPNHHLNKQARMEISETQRTQQLRWPSLEANISADAGWHQMLMRADIEVCN